MRTKQANRCNMPSVFYAWYALADVPAITSHSVRARWSLSLPPTVQESWPPSSFRPTKTSGYRISRANNCSSTWAVPGGSVLSSQQWVGDGKIRRGSFNKGGPRCCKTQGKKEGIFHLSAVPRALTGEVSVVKLWGAPSPRRPRPAENLAKSLLEVTALLRSEWGWGEVSRHCCALWTSVVTPERRLISKQVSLLTPKIQWSQEMKKIQWVMGLVNYRDTVAWVTPPYFSLFCSVP